MAGAGYKLFNTGDVLTAAQVNTYLMQQTVMVFASSAARTSALSGVLAEGMVSYLQDSNTLEVYDGSAWVGATGDITGLTAGTGISISSATGPVPTITNSVATTFDALGDLVVGTGADTFAKLTVGNSGETIVADSSQTTGLRYNPPVGSLANPIINGGMDVWQRGTSFTATGYTADRWNGVISAGTCTFSRSTDAPSNFTYSLSMASVNGTNPQIQNRIESLNSTPFAGKTVTVSFWAKSSSGSNQLFLYTSYPDSTDNFASQTQDLNQGFTITSSWVRYSHTFTVNALATRGYQIVLYRNDTTQSSTTLITGIQMDLGTWTASTAPTFRRSGGTLAGELIACQRYYWRAGDGTGGAYGVLGTSGYTESTTISNVVFVCPVRMRTAPTVLDTSAYANTRILNFGNPFTATAASIADVSTTPDAVWVQFTSSGMTASQFSQFTRNNSATAFIGFSAEL